LGTDRVALRIRTDGNPDFRVLIVAFSSRVTTTLEALVELVGKGCGQQAIMLNRAAFELMLDCYWIDCNRELAIKDSAIRPFPTSSRPQGGGKVSGSL
jgi:hypothetical protein